MQYITNVAAGKGGANFNYFIYYYILFDLYFVSKSVK